MAVVYFRNGSKRTAEHVSKKDWGVIVIQDGEKHSYPWYRVERIWEAIE